jgi:hypothetical protein
MGTSCLLWAHFAQIWLNGPRKYGKLLYYTCQVHRLNVSFTHSQDRQYTNLLLPNFYGKISYHGFDIGKNSYAHPPVFLLTLIRDFCLKLYHDIQVVRSCLNKNVAREVA